MCEKYKIRPIAISWEYKDVSQSVSENICITLRAYAILFILTQLAL